MTIVSSLHKPTAIHKFINKIDQSSTSRIYDIEIKN